MTDINNYLNHLIGVGGAARILGVTRQTVLNWIEAGTLQGGSAHDSNATLLLVSDVEAEKARRDKLEPAPTNATAREI